MTPSELETIKAKRVLTPEDLNQLIEEVHSLTKRFNEITEERRLQQYDLRQENARLREALEFYADYKNYTGIIKPGTGPVLAKRARTALGMKEGEKNGK